MTPEACPIGHYWPGECQPCDTAWNAAMFTCQIVGHDYDRHDLCRYCEAYRPNHADESWIEDLPF